MCCLLYIMPVVFVQCVFTQHSNLSLCSEFCAVCLHTTNLIYVNYVCTVYVHTKQPYGV